MHKSWKAGFHLLLWAGAVALVHAQANQAGPDTIIFTNGDKLAGHFVRASDSSVTFQNDALANKSNPMGTLSIDWSKVRELDTAGKVAVLRKGVKFRRHHTPLDIPIGTLQMQNQTLQITAAPGSPVQPIPLAQSAVVIDQDSFQKAANRSPGIFNDWTGTITAGATLVQATQTNRTFTAGVAVVRAEPTEDWLNPSYRTSFAFTESYGRLTQPGAITIKTSIFHGAAEQDQYFTSAVFAFGQADFDHNYSQGLDLQQTYNGGIGWTVVKNAAEQLDLKASVNYIRQQFLPAANGVTPPSLSLVGSGFSEHYLRKFARGATLDESLSATPAWNNTSAYSAAFSTLLTIPVYKHLSGSTGVIDTFLNDPPPGFKKNSFQFTLGVTYALP